MIAGTGSGCGKTTVVCSVLGALQGRKLSLRSYKCGPDYIDPMLHSKVLGVPCRNLDSFLCGEETLKYLFASKSLSHCVSVIEGVMGYYDGLSGISTTASSHHIAQTLKAPVVLVVNCKGKSLSVAAEVQGFLQFTPNRIKAVILNGVSSGSYPMYKRIIETHTGTEVLGFLPIVPEAVFESRHLGLVTAQEITNLRKKVYLLAEQAGKTIDLDRLLEIARDAGELEYEPINVQHLPVSVRIGIAQDFAFCFYYQDSIELLQMMGANFIPFSPVVDTVLPPNLHGLLLGGGYPELYARQLSLNRPMLDSIAQAVQSGMPTIAECGGFMLLCKELKTLKGDVHRMAGVLNTSVEMTNKLSNFGYVTLTAKRDNMLCGEGESFPAHEFHYSTASDTGDGFTACKANGTVWSSAHVGESLYAGYPHLHLWGNRNAARRFMERCIAYRRAL